MLIDGKEADHACGIVTEDQLRNMLRLRDVRKERVRAVKEFRGAISKRAYDSFEPVHGLVSDADAWKELCEAWKLDDAAFEIDFDRQFVMVRTTDGSRVSITLEKDGHGNLRDQTRFTADIRRDGFRYLVAVVSREGVKSVNGVELPAIQTH
jgi:hypothetical protein